MTYLHPHMIPGAARRAPILASLILLLALAGGCQRPEPPGEQPAPSASQQIVLDDALGEKIVLEGPARRVISLAPNLTEIAYALGAGESLVGRSSYCDYPPQALKIEPVGDMLTLNYEKVLALKPDLVMMTFTGNQLSIYRKLKQIGVRVFAFQDTTVSGVFNAMEQMGTLLGKRNEAATAIGGLRRRIDSIATLTRQGSGRPVSTFIVIDRAPLMSVTWGFIVQALEIAGGDNIAKEGVTAYPLYSREELLRRDPEVILVPGNSQSVVQELIALYPEWKKLQAVRNNRIYVIPPDLILRPGPRIGDGIEMLYGMLHEGVGR